MAEDLESYFRDFILILLEASPFSELSEDPSVEYFESNIARLEATIHYQDRSKLYARVTVDFAAGFPEFRHYSFHYETSNGRTIFRYDNSTNHPNLPYFPHHKHEGPLESVSPSECPSLHSLQREIDRYLRREVN